MRQPTCEVPFATRVQASSWITEAPDWSARGELAERTSSSTLEAADRWMAVPILRSPRVEGERTAVSGSRARSIGPSSVGEAERLIRSSADIGKTARLQQPERTKRCVFCVTDHK